jgi:predicted O-methyltransferase YrrM
MPSPSQPNIVQMLLRDRPAFHMGGEAHWSAMPETLQAIRASVKPGDSTVETGVGASTVVFASAGAEHTAVSPDPEEHNRVREYCRRIGVTDSGLTFIAGLSDDVLPSLLDHDRTLDVGFIDGAHSFPFPELDWYYITRSLKIGGRLLMDDITIPAVTEVFHHMRLEPHWRLESVLDERAASFTLLAPPPTGDTWIYQRYNRRYPDFSFAGLPERLRLQATFRATQARHGLVRRYPLLRSVYKRLT